MDNPSRAVARETREEEQKGSYKVLARSTQSVVKLGRLAVPGTWKMGVVLTVAGDEACCKISSTSLTC